MGQACAVACCRFRGQAVSLNPSFLFELNRAEVAVGRVPADRIVQLSTQKTHGTEAGDEKRGRLTLGIRGWDAIFVCVLEVVERGAIASARCSLAGAAPFLSEIRTPKSRPSGFYWSVILDLISATRASKSWPAKASEPHQSAGYMGGT